MNITSIVTREEVATESVDIISFSLLPTSASAISLAFAAQGSFRFVRDSLPLGQEAEHISDIPQCRREHIR